MNSLVLKVIVVFQELEKLIKAKNNLMIFSKQVTKNLGHSHAAMDSQSKHALLIDNSQQRQDCTSDI